MMSAAVVKEPSVNQVVLVGGGSTAGRARQAHTFRYVLDITLVAKASVGTGLSI